MTPPRLRDFFGLSTSLVIAHGIEEMLTGIHLVDPQVTFIFGWLPFPLATSFLVFQLVFWGLLITAYLLILSGKFVFPITFALGLIYLYEFHHFYSAFTVGGYYPGLITALGFPILGYFYRNELIQTQKFIR